MRRTGPARAPKKKSGDGEDAGLTPAGAAPKSKDAKRKLAAGAGDKPAKKPRAEARGLQSEYSEV